MKFRITESQLKFLISSNKERNSNKTSITLERLKEVIDENIFKDILFKADLVKDDLRDFYNTLEEAAKKGGLNQQSRGNMSYQKEVESLQIGLSLLGYTLPKHGIDGLFGPETANAVKKFKEDHKDQINKNNSFLDFFKK